VRCTTFSDLANKIDVTKKYLIICDGFEYCNLCQISGKESNDLCKKCDKKLDLEHIYYTDDKIMKNNTIIDIKKCNLCKNTYRCVKYDNTFLDIIIPKDVTSQFFYS